MSKRGPHHLKGALDPRPSPSPCPLTHSLSTYTLTPPTSLKQNNFYNPTHSKRLLILHTDHNPSLPKLTRPPTPQPSPGPQAREVAKCLRSQKPIAHLTKARPFLATTRDKSQASEPQSAHLYNGDDSNIYIIRY